MTTSLIISGAKISGTGKWIVEQWLKKGREKNKDMIIYT